MLENMMERGLISLVESNHLRLEAMRLFEQCLTNGDPAVLIAFIEQQLMHEPPRLQLLRDLADDLQQRLLSLREYHFDVRDRVIRTLGEEYQIDITPLAPPSMLDEYHHLTADQIFGLINAQSKAISEADSVLLRKMIEASLQMAAQLYDDIQLTIRLHNFVLDWVEGFSATIARQQWNALHESNERQIYH